jgi:hypothetical protein
VELILPILSLNIEQECIYSLIVVEKKKYLDRLCQITVYYVIRGKNEVLCAEAVSLAAERSERKTYKGADG